MKKGGLIAGLAAFIIVGAVLVWFIANKAAAPNNTTQNNTSSSNNTSSTDTTTDQVQSGTAAVVMQGEAFSPQTIKVKKGTKVTWTNNDSIGHNVVADDAKNAAGMPTTNSLISKGGTYSFTFNTTGTFSYHCTPHPFMTGTVEVVE